METFCSKPLMIRDFNVQFHPELKQPKPERLLKISFFNVPPERPEKNLTEFINEYADIKGNMIYPQTSTMESSTAQGHESIK